ncbi:head-tail connector protein [Rickettsiales bacterium]|nr:head-tail connector protein [Rickettsiales bacterium]
MASIPYLKIQTAPASEPITLTEAKNYLRVDGSDDDTYITNLIVATRQVAEKYMHNSLITQTWKMSFDQYAPTNVNLQMGPVQSISSVKIITRNESETTLDSSAYYLNAGNERLIFDACPVSHKIEILYVTGYGDAASDVPEPIRNAILAHMAAIYDDRAGGDVIPQQSRELYNAYRLLRV